MVKKPKKGNRAEGALPRLSDVVDSGEADLHTAQINVSEESIDRFSHIFEDAVSRWEHIIYPAMIIMAFAFAYGFFLMFNLSNDMRRISKGFDPDMGSHMEALVNNMTKLTNSIDDMHQDMKIIARVMPSMDNKLTAMKEMTVMSQNVGGMNRKIGVMNERMSIMNGHMEGMNRQMDAMNRRMHVMTSSVSDMNRSFGRPISFFSQFAPW